MYLVILGDSGFGPWMLPGLGLDWSKEKTLMVAGEWLGPHRGNVLCNPSLGTGENYIKRDETLRAAQTGFFISIVIVQWADVVICKTRMLSLFQQGMKYVAAACRCWTRSYVPSP